MANKQLTFTTLSEYLEWANNLGVGKFVFRGVSNEDYIKDKLIEASTCRRLKKSKPYDFLSESEKTKLMSSEEIERPKRLLYINKEMIKDARSHGHDDKDGIHLSDLDLLAELQHYGAATCLIDFTYNAMVALWFACQPSSEENVNGKVVAVDLLLSHKVTDTEAEKNIGCFFRHNVDDGYQFYHWQPKNQNNRIIAQRSIFIFGSFTVDASAECVIPNEKKANILYALDETMGITEESLFPDFDGFASQRSHDKEYTGADVSDYINHADIALKSGHYDEAIRFCTEGISLHPDNFDIGFLLVRKAEAHYKNDQQTEAIKDCEKLIKLHESNYMPYLLKLSLNLRAQIYEDNNEHNSALKYYNKILTQYPESAEVHYNLGRVKKHLKCDSEAKNYLQKALELVKNKDNMQVVNNEEELIEKITKELCDLKCK